MFLIQRNCIQFFRNTLYSNLHKRYTKHGYKILLNLIKKHIKFYISISILTWMCNDLSSNMFLVQVTTKIVVSTRFFFFNTIRNPCMSSSMKI